MEKVGGRGNGLFCLAIYNGKRMEVKKKWREGRMECWKNGKDKPFGPELTAEGFMSCHSPSPGCFVRRRGELNWWAMRDSNARPLVPETNALST